MGAIIPGKNTIPSGSQTAPGLPYTASPTTGFYRDILTGGFDASYGGNVCFIAQDNNFDVRLGEVLVDPVSGGENAFIGYNTGAGSPSVGQSVLIGHQAGMTLTGTNNILIGKNSDGSIAPCSNAVVIGDSAVTWGGGSVVVGNAAVAGFGTAGTNSVVIGNAAACYGVDAVVIGAGAVGAAVPNALTISNTSTVTPLISGVFDPLGGAAGSLNINGTFSVLGVPVITTIPNGTVAAPGLSFTSDTTTGFFYDAANQGFCAASTGLLALIIDTVANDVRLGIVETLPPVSAGENVFIGHNSANSGTAQNCVYVGSGAGQATNASGVIGIGFGAASNLTGITNAICIGFGAMANGIGGIAIGDNATAGGISPLGVNSVAIGNFAACDNDASVAIGNNAVASGVNSLAISNTNTTTPLVSGTFDPLGGKVGTLNLNADLVVNTGITPPGTTGNQTIDLTSGRVNIAAGGSAITVTNALVVTDSLVFPVVATNDATALIKNCVPTNGSFTIHMNAPVTAETAISFVVFNGM